jgi:hypothetical protein
MKKMMAMMLVAAMGIGVVGTAQPAMADHHRGHGWFGAGVALAGLAVLDAVFGSRFAACEEPAPVYCPPPVVYSPPPVVYAPPVYCPPPVVYPPVFIQAPIYRPPVFRIQPIAPPTHPWQWPNHRPANWRGDHRR